MTQYNIGNISGGLQSTTMSWASFKGLIPPFDLLIFADTGWERESTYRTIESVEKAAKDFGIPFQTVSNGNIREQAIESGNTNSTYGDWRDEEGYGFLKMPVYTIDGLGNKSMSSKQCTTEFKIHPIQNHLRERFGEDATFKQNIGISLDETQRMRKSALKYITFHYPLVFDLKWARSHCIEWLKSENIPVPSKSSCIGCPLHDAENWQMLNEKEREDVIEFDRHIRHMQAHVNALPKPKKIPIGQLTLIDMTEVDEYIARYPLKVRQKTRIYVHRDVIPVEDVISGNHKEEQIEYNSEDEGGCGGDCFI